MQVEYMYFQVRLEFASMPLMSFQEKYKVLSMHAWLIYGNPCYNHEFVALHAVNSFFFWNKIAIAPYVYLSIYHVHIKNIPDIKRYVHVMSVLHIDSFWKQTILKLLMWGYIFILSFRKPAFNVGTYKSK